MTAMPLPVAVVQLAASTDAAANVRAAVDRIQAAAAGGARLVILPEYTSGWAPRLSADLAPEELFAAAIAQVTAENGVDVVVGSMEPVDGAPSRCRNVALVFGPDGTVRGRYEKVHLFDAFGIRESDLLDAGEPSALVLDVAGVQVGIATCYDLRFPESFRVLADGGAQLLVVIAAWADGPGKGEQLDVLARARAIENTAYLALASQHGKGRTGRSQVIDPLGQVICRVDDGDHTLAAQVDPGLVDEVREQVPSLRHRRYRVVPQD